MINTYHPKFSSMKKLELIFVALGLIGLATACNHNKRHVVIGNNAPGHEEKIEYWGHTIFNEDGTGIRSITPNGSALYVKNGEEILAESDSHGQITYTINDGPKQTTLDSNSRRLLAIAVKEMVKRSHNDR